MSDEIYERKALYPIVEFEYPSSEDKKLKLRVVRVTRCDADYVQGYELETIGSRKPGQFKIFDKRRIARNGVSLIAA